MHLQRWPSSSNGRSRTVACGDFVWTVATASDSSVGFEQQVVQSLNLLDDDLRKAGSARTHIISLQVLLSDIADRPKFDRLWQEWIGPNPLHWPQRACFGAPLAPGLLVELMAVAAASSATLGGQT